VVGVSEIAMPIANASTPTSFLLTWVAGWLGKLYAISLARPWITVSMLASLIACTSWSASRVRSPTLDDSNCTDPRRAGRLLAAVLAVLPFGPLVLERRWRRRNVLD
jgi:hypothetical protein